jgi:PAS domain S-box-containing protein
MQNHSVILMTGADTPNVPPTQAFGAPAPGLASILFDDSRDALLLITADDTVTRVNNEWTVFCGGEREALIGRRVEDAICATSACEILDLVRRAKGGGEPVNARVNYRHPNGFELILDALVAPVAAAGAVRAGYLVRLRPAGRNRF